MYIDGSTWVTYKIRNEEMGNEKRGNREMEADSMAKANVCKASYMVSSTIFS